MRLTARLVPLTLATMAVVAAAQQPPAGVSMPPAVLARLQVAEEQARRAPDSAGTGRYRAIKEEDRSLPDHVVYRPADLAALGGRALPIVVWGNGGCAGDGAAQRQHLLDIASHGYLVIANGTIQSGPGAPPQPPRPPMAAPKPGQPFVPPPPQTSAAQLTRAIDWALAENARAGSPYRGRLDPAAVAVSGWSCGGIQALGVAADPRVKAVIIHNSGLFPDTAPRMAGMELHKDALARLHTPILYVLGGPTDIAYANGMDDYARISRVPAVVANLKDAGHTGSFFAPAGGKAATVAVAWLDWQLRGDRQAAAMFTGADCGLCHDPAWSIERKGL
jgi:dienelactone hydrolase